MKMRLNILGISLVLLILTLFSVSAEAADKLVNILKEKEEITSLFPAKQTFMVDMIAEGKKYAEVLTVTVNKATGELVADSLSDFGGGKATFDKTLSFMQSSSYTSSKDLIKEQEFDKIASNYNQKDKKILTQLFLGNRKTKEYEVDFDRNTIADVEFVPLYLQACLLKGARDFSADVSMSGKVIGVAFELTKTADFEKLSPKYKFPVEFKGILKEKEEVYVYVMKVKGLYGIVFPHKFYYAFKKNELHDIIAFWGGPPKQAVFALYDKQ